MNKREFQKKLEELRKHHENALNAGSIDLDDEDSFNLSVSLDKFIEISDKFFQVKRQPSDNSEQLKSEIIPAEPLRVMPKKGTICYFVDTVYNKVTARSFSRSNYDFSLFQAGLIFPYDPEIKADLFHRASKGIVPYPVQPAKALTEPLEKGERYWACDDNENVVSLRWDGDDVDLEYLPEGRCFPYTRAGKLGAAMFQEGGQDE